MHAEDFAFIFFGASFGCVVCVTLVYASFAREESLHDTLVLAFGVVAAAVLFIGWIASLAAIHLRAKRAVMEAEERLELSQTSRYGSLDATFLCLAPSDWVEEETE